MLQLPSIRRAFIRYTGITGPLDCALVNNPSLILLSVSGNNITGTIPECFLNVSRQAAKGSPATWHPPANSSTFSRAQAVSKANSLPLLLPDRRTPRSRSCT